MLHNGAESDYLWLLIDMQVIPWIILFIWGVLKKMWCTKSPWLLTYTKAWSSMTWMITGGTRMTLEASLILETRSNCSLHQALLQAMGWCSWENWPETSGNPSSQLSTENLQILVAKDPAPRYPDAQMYNLCAEELEGLAIQSAPLQLAVQLNIAEAHLAKRYKMSKRL